MRPTLRPEPGGRGLASTDPHDVADLVAQAWDEHPVFTRLLADARAGRVHEQDDLDARNTLLVTAHHDADATEIVEALERARDHAVGFLRSPEVETLGREWSSSPIGPLPVTGVVAASAYELAVHALDVAEPAVVPAALLDAGVAALVDTTAALAARAGIEAALVVSTPVGGWAAGSASGDWTTLRLGHDVRALDLHWPTIEGSAADVLDATAGRRQAVGLILGRRLRLHDVPGLLTLLPALESVPDLPGGVALRAAARVLAGTGRLVGRVGGLAHRDN